MTMEPPSTRSTPSPVCSAPGLRGALALLLLVSGCGSGNSSQAVSPAAPASQWTLSWADEFNGATGSSPDPAHWTFDNTGDLYNEELETYTSRTVNVQQRNGNLVITALKEDTTRPDGTTRHYTSGRIFSKGLFSQTYGRFEASIQLPLGKGIWPAFWMLGSNIDTVNWPTCGEIDILENIGEPSVTYSSLHSKGYDSSTRYTMPAGQAVNTAFHLYAVEWIPGDVKFYLDNVLVAEQTPANLPVGANWAFDHPFYLLFNVAVGGSWPGSPDQTTIWPQQMLVDYVRVYKPADSTGSKAAQQQAKP